MHDIMNTVLLLICMSVLAKVLTAFTPVKAAIVKKVVARMECKFAAYEKSGEKKKAQAMKILKWLLVQSDEVTSFMIDAVVSLARERSEDMNASLKTLTTAEIKARMTTLQMKVTGGGDQK